MNHSKGAFIRYNHRKELGLKIKDKLANLYTIRSDVDLKKSRRKQSTPSDSNTIPGFDFFKNSLSKSFNSTSTFLKDCCTSATEKAKSLQRGISLSKVKRKTEVLKANIQAFTTSEPQIYDRQFESRAYRGSRTRDYRLVIPSKVSSHPTKPVPLVLVLHGCKQDHLDIEHISEFSKLAEKEGFIVVYPFITSYAGLRFRNCWGWWMRSQREAGSGEVEDLHQLILELCEEFPVDQNRIHVTGLSSGAGMTVALMVTRNSLIASGAPVAGVCYGETARAINLMGNFVQPGFQSVEESRSSMTEALEDPQRPIPILITHSKQDGTVHFQSGENLRDTWAQAYGIDTQHPAASKFGQTKGCQWHFESFNYPKSYGSESGKSRTLIETLWLDGPDHGWYGGEKGDFSYPDAPNISEQIWSFFKSHPKQ